MDGFVMTLTEIVKTLIKNPSLLLLPYNTLIHRKINHRWRKLFSFGYCRRCQYHIHCKESNSKIIEERKKQGNYYFADLTYSSGIIEIDYGNIHTVSKRLKAFQSELMRKMNDQKDFYCKVEIRVEWPVMEDVDV